MEIIVNPNIDLLACLGKQGRMKDKKYRLNRFCLIEDFINGKLIHNMMTSSFIFMTNSEFSKIYDIENTESWHKFLYDAYFLVEENFDEHKFITDYRERNRVPLDDFYLESINSYTILTTTGCNARCFYCYEQKVKKSTMTVQTAEKIVDYIMLKTPKDQHVDLRWFGGEPLFNMKVINTICKKLQDNGYSYSSSFTTNGYLFDSSIIKKAKELWHTTSCQITIDGTENVYNKAKNYIYKDCSSPYKKVLNNIEELTNNGIFVIIRMNVDLYNADDLKDLIYELYQRFGNNPRINPYLYPIFENEFYERSEEDRHKVFEKMKEIEVVMSECNMLDGSGIDTGVRLNHCMVDNGHSVVISPNGDLGLCEHYVDSDFWGHIDEPEKMDMEVVKAYKVYEPDLDICKDCPIYPQCVRNSKCEEQSRCYPDYKEWLIRKAKYRMKNSFSNYMRNKNNR